MRKLTVAGMKALAQLNKSDIIVMLELMEVVDKAPVYPENSICLNIHKPMINMNINTLNDSIRNLYNAKLLIRIAHGRYEFSERLFN